jgi:hypothetical protein
LGQFQTPDKELQKQPPKKPDTKPGKAAKETLYGMRGLHPFRICLDGRGISRILFQYIKVDKVPAGAIHEEAKQLFEYFCHGLAFGAFANAPEEPLDQGHQTNRNQVPHIKVQPTSRGQGISGYSYFINNGTSIAIITSGHNHLQPIGFRLILRSVI